MHDNPGETSRLRPSRRPSLQPSLRRGLTALAMAAAMAASLQGCASDNNPNGDPGARPLPQGYSCQSIKSEMSKLDARGVRSAVEAKQAGQKLSPGRAADADRYNQLLSYYLGARCHSQPH